MSEVQSPKSGGRLGDASLPLNQRLPVQTVERLHRLVGGDARTEAMVLEFIADRYQARSLAMLPERVASQILLRPRDFLLAVKQHCEPELPI